MLGFLLGGAVSVLVSVILFTGPTYLAARFFDAGHKTLGKSAMAVAMGTAVGYAVGVLLGQGWIALLMFLVAASAVVMVVLDLSLVKAMGTVLFSAVLVFSIIATLPEFTAHFFPTQIHIGSER